ncbi:MAG: Fe-S cluster assembly ATP-binding protein [Parcubacteria group bacterium Gr01-1014_33]|nr:MAG: Fe-S cluster assembly ATP-binding protein [Parcubacteria group bacterium Gr01-1014_33]
MTILLSAKRAMAIRNHFTSKMETRQHNGIYGEIQETLALSQIVVRVNERVVVSDFSLTVLSGKIHALMGPNGSGKSSLAYAIAGHPSYIIERGLVSLGDKDITKLSPEERAKQGLFLSFQEPPEVGGVSMRTFLATIAKTPSLNPSPAGRGREGVGEEYLTSLRLEDSFLSRFLNEGFSGGEKKKSEILQFMARKPKFAIFDEIDSGLDVDALKEFAHIMQDAAKQGAGILVISHSPRLFSLLPPDRVHIVIEGRIAASGGKELIKKVEEKGYGVFATKYEKVRIYEKDDTKQS